MWPGFDTRTQRHKWVEFVVGSGLCSERFFSGYSGFPLSSNTNICKFQFDLDYCQAFYHEPLAWDILQALPVLLTLKNLLYCTYFGLAYGHIKILNKDNSVIILRRLLKMSTVSFCV